MNDIRYSLLMEWEEPDEKHKGEKIECRSTIPIDIKRGEVKINLDMFPSFKNHIIKVQIALEKVCRKM